MGKILLTFNDQCSCVLKNKNTQCCLISDLKHPPDVQHRLKISQIVLIQGHDVMTQPLFWNVNTKNRGIASTGQPNR